MQAPQHDLAADEVEFALTMERYVRLGHPFPTWREVLLVLKALGYRKVRVETKEMRPHSE